jgi:hypothetical protein
VVFWGVSPCGPEGGYQRCITSIFMSIFLKMEAIRFAETLVATYNTARRHNPEDHNRHLHYLENLKSQTFIILILACCVCKHRIQFLKESKRTPVSFDWSMVQNVVLSSLGNAYHPTHLYCRLSSTFDCFCWDPFIVGWNYSVDKGGITLFIGGEDLKTNPEERNALPVSFNMRASRTESIPRGFER